MLTVLAWVDVRRGVGAVLLSGIGTGGSRSWSLHSLVLRWSNVLPAVEIPIMKNKFPFKLQIQAKKK